MFVHLISVLLVGVVYNWNDIRESVASWLRKNNLSKSALMDAWIKFDKVASNIRVRLFAKTQKTGVQNVEEKNVSPEQLKKEDPDVYAELLRRGQAERNIMNQVT